MFRKIPLAWLQLTREKTRFLVALSGISFANILMFVQLGLREALFDSAVQFHKSLEGEIFLISPQSVALISMEEFSERRLYQAMSVEGVQSVSPIYLDFALWKNPLTHKNRSIFVIGYNPSDRVFNLPEIQQNTHKLKAPDVVFFDKSSRSEYGISASELNSKNTFLTEVRNRKIQVVDFFEIGPSFGADGNLITSDLNFLRLFNNRKKGLINIGAIQLKNNTDINKIMNTLVKYLPKDVKVVSKEELIKFEKIYWNSSTSIGFIFTLGTALGFLVGTVIVYQIIYSDVSDHLPEYATLKAMGYHNNYFLFVVFQEALVLAVLGYIPGLSISLAVYAVIGSATLLPIIMTIHQAMLVLFFTFLMCLISGAVAAHKLQLADPADIF